MTVLMRAREITGRPVVAISSADAVAEVKDVVISHPSASVVGFTLNKRGFLGSPLKEVLPWERLGALGRDAVMIDTAGTPCGTSMRYLPRDVAVSLRDLIAERSARTAFTW